MRVSHVSRVDPAGLAALPALAPFVIRPGCTPAQLPAAPTGLPSLDVLLGGGFPRGRISEVVGARGSGRTSVLLGSLARTTGRGALAALVDVVDRLDPASARTAGLALGQLLWVRCGGDLRTAIQAADVIVRGGGFDLVAVDLGELPPWRLQRVPAAAFVRLQRAVEGTPTALVLAGVRRVAGSMAATALTLCRTRPRWEPGGPGLLAGLATEVRLVRSRERAPGASAVLAWTS